MSKLWVLGDLHLSGETPWKSAVSRNVIDWVANHEYNSPENEILLAGDLIDKYHASPASHNLVIQFLTSLQASKIHIVVGNHDIEISADGQSLAYEYARSLGSHIHVYEYPIEIQSKGLQILALPFYKGPTHSLVDLKKPVQGDSQHPLDRWHLKADKAYDLAIVHHFLKAPSQSHIPDEITLDMDYLVPNAKKVLAGHVHTADSLPDKYLGSVYAMKVDEQGQRYHWVYDEDTKRWMRYKTPVFCELKTVKYGEKLPQANNPEAIPVYTITQCPSVEKARSYYGNEPYIRKTVSSWDHIRTNQEFSEIDRERYNGAGMISKEELMGRFEEMVLSDVEEWKKKDITQDTLKAAVKFIRDISQDNVNQPVKESQDAAN